MEFIKLVAYFDGVAPQLKDLAFKPDISSLQGIHTAVEMLLCLLENEKFRFRISPSSSCLHRR